MNINKNNYEAFFLDYHEGNLTPHQVADLLLFIEQYPELKEEFESFENIVFHEISEIKFENKNNLKRNISDDLLISSMEGLLSKEKDVLLSKQLLVDSKLQQEFLLYQKTKLTPDVFIVFENKNDLKHKEKKIVPIYYYVAVAASLLLLIGLFFMFNNSVNENKLVNREVKTQKLELRSQGVGVEKPINENQFVTENKKEESFDQLHISTVKNNNQEVTVMNDSEVGTEKIGTGNQKPEEKEAPVVNNQPATNLSAEGIAQGGNQESATNNQQPTTSFPPVKEKPLYVEAPTVEKKNAGFKKLNGWDLAQLAAKRFNKLTGKNVSVKPTYNEQGDVTAYSLAAGEFQITRGR